VDNSGPVRQLLKRLLSALPQFQLVGEAENGCLALDAIIRLDPDLTILDIHMPGMSGLEVLQALRSKGLTRKVIVFSQLGEEVCRQRCLELGAHDFFDKITGFDRFHQALKEMGMPP
jgi:CitB family two-component system response regulator MalR